MRILHVIPSLGVGGAERLTLDICNELKRQGHEVKLVYFHDKNDYQYLCGQINPLLLPVHARPSIAGKWDVNLEPWNELIRNFKPDVIHSHLFEAEVLSRENLVEGIKYFSHCHDNMPQFRNFSFETIFKKRWITDFYEKRHLLKKYLQCDNKFIAISNDTKQYFEKSLPSKLSRNIFLLNNAVDFKRFNKVNHQRKLDAIRMVNVGSFVVKKNQQFLIDVVKELIERKVEVKLVMLGEGPLLNKVKKKINDYGLQNFIECKGNVENVEDYLSEANLYIHSATYEPFGLALLEAMAAGLIVISLDGKGNRDIMKGGENGFILRNPDAKAFAEKIASLFKDHEFYKKLSLGAVNTSRQYDIVEYVRKLIALYEQGEIKA